MTDDMRTSAWMDGYLRAWKSNERADIVSLFTEDAVYLTAPFDEPRTGIDAIVGGWLDDRDAPDGWSFTWRPLVGAGDTATIVGETVYADGPTYSNLWVIRFADDGRCIEYTEWYMNQSESS